LNLSDHGNSGQERGIMEIKRVTEDDRVGEFINIEFSDYAVDSNIALNFEEFCFVAEDDGNIVGVITGRAYYNEVHIGDLIVGKSYRKDGVGSKLVAAVEDAYKGKGYEKIALTTFGFQAPEFYKKLGYELEFIRKDTDPRLSKYFYLKKI
jgi:ribosomal protein S18 acetylase RimI-like enzyme